MEFLNIKQQDSIAIVSINRPTAMNALSKHVLKEFCSLQEYFRKDLETRVIIFTGEGDHFSAGADLKEKAQLSSKLESWRNNFGKPAIKSILDIDQITIAAVNGYCLGGAACIASACDFRGSKLQSNTWLSGDKFRHQFKLAWIAFSSKINWSCKSKKDGYWW